MELVNRLQEENKRIKQSENYMKCSDDDGKQVPKKQSEIANLLNESDFHKLKRLRGQMEKQRDELMCRDQEIEEKNTEIENVCVSQSEIQKQNPCLYFIHVTCHMAIFI